MVWFIDKLGKEYSDEKISSHIGLAMLIMEKDPKLKEEYKNSDERNPALFLLRKKGWMMGSLIKRQVVYNSSTLTEKQRRWLQYYVAEEGYKKDDIFDISKELDDEVDRAWKTIEFFLLNMLEKETKNSKYNSRRPKIDNRYKRKNTKWKKLKIG